MRPVSVLILAVVLHTRRAAVRVVEEDDSDSDRAYLVASRSKPRGSPGVFFDLKKGSW